MILIALLQPGDPIEPCPEIADQVPSVHVRAAIRRALPVEKSCRDLSEVTALRFVEPVRNLAGIEKLESLTSLSLYDVPGGDLSPLSALPKLSALSIGPPPWATSIDERTHIEDLTPLSALKSLESLTLVSAKPRTLKPLAALKLLTHLVIDNSDVQNLEGLQGCTALKVLSLDGAGIREIKPLAGLSQLTQLNLAGNRLKDLSPLAGKKALTELDVSFNPRLVDLEPLAETPALERLRARMTAVASVEPLLKLTRLLEVDVCLTPAASGVGVVQSLEADGVMVRAKGPICHK
ncbi:MAG: leucine-rich repeat domain-containing protein [Bradymonadia bacterium]